MPKLNPWLKNTEMQQKIEIEEFLELAENIPVIDVRSPSEYQHAHIPGAYNLPLFNDSERARVGTLYKKTGRDEAILLGLEIAGKKLADLVQAARKIAPGKKILIHCWRGGMRSSSLAWLLNTAGFETKVLNGGYKSYRRYIKSQFSRKAKIVVLGGMTGSGKTEILQELAKMNQQVIDLEKLAHHKGSAFGALGQEEQYSTEQFENLLFNDWKKLDLNKISWIEDESQAIGQIRIPEEIYLQMRQSPLVFIKMPKGLRIERLNKEYGDFDKELLINSIERIKKRLGGQNVNLALEAIKSNDIKKAIDISLTYYDKAYLYGLSKRNIKSVFECEINQLNPEENARVVLDFLNKIKV
jgi:tRNA 2-selenouridine synthase